MTTEILLVFVILTVTIALFVSDRLRLDLVALLALLALTLTGLITPREAIAGFSDPVVIMLAGLFVVSAGLFQTGVADRMGKVLGRLAGHSEVRLIALVMLATATLSAFMSSTGTVAVMLPVVVSLAWNARLSPSKLLIPLSFASLLGGMLTLIGTPPNLVASNQAVAAGLPPLGFFAFTPVGLGMLAIGLAFMLLVGRHLLPSRAPAAAEETARSVISQAELANIYQLRGSLFRVRVPPASTLVGRTLAQAAVRQRYRITVLAKQRSVNNGVQTEIAEPKTLIETNDTLFIRGYEAEVAEFIEAEGLIMLPVSLGDDELLPSNLLFAEVLLTPRSRLIGKTLRDVRFYEHYGITVVAIKRLGEPLAADTAAIPLRFGDTLLIEGSSKNLDTLKNENRDFVVVAEPVDTGSKRRAAKRAPVAIAIMLGMLLLMTLEIVPIVIATLLAAVVMVLTRCLSMEDAYRGINWESIVLIAGILPMATALDKTGGMQLIVSSLGGLAEYGPLVMLGALFVITSAFSQVISNTATTVLVAPIALQLALALGVSPYPFLMAVAIAASTAFTTPIASPVNTLVLGPGRYRFGDFFKVGISLQLLLLVAALLLIPLFFPF
ncbi:MAG: SLC13 family permease [Truepera sp.]|nr:SLC13 family permease [Truepera sp.]